MLLPGGSLGGFAYHEAMPSFFLGLVFTATENRKNCQELAKMKQSCLTCFLILPSAAWALLRRAPALDDLQEMFRLIG